MRNFFKSIRYKTWIVFIVFTAAMLVFLYVAQSGLMPAFYRYMKTQESMQSASIIKANWSEDSTSNLIAVVDNLAIQQQMDILINFPDLGIDYNSNRSGSGTTTLKRRVNDTIKNELLNSRTGTLLLSSTDDGKDALLLATYVGEKDNIIGYIFIYNYLEPLGTTFSILQGLYIMSAGILLFIACLLSIFLASRIANPIVKISRSANKLITGEFNMPINHSDYLEIAMLVENLNEASVEIAKTETLRKDLMANISHDLRTPLTMIKAYAEMIRDLSGNNPEKREKHLKVIIDEADRLTALVADILNLSKLQSGVADINTSLFNFSEHLTGIVSRFGILNTDDENHDCNIVHEITENIWIDADITKLEQVVYNLVNNAINYIGEDNTIIVRLFMKNKKTARFEVTDHGIGIPAENLPYIWERYYKVDRSENHKRVVKGTGLGLSIVKGVLEAHSFNYGVDSVVGEGSTFWFEFNVAASDTAQ